ncbi:hypothetical protein L209DRAFT_116154 [Thermothelomyces heterothallicus CBS 203.75]
MPRSSLVWALLISRFAPPCCTCCSPANADEVAPRPTITVAAFPSILKMAPGTRFCVPVVWCQIWGFLSLKIWENRPQLP